MSGFCPFSMQNTTQTGPYGATERAQQNFQRLSEGLRSKSYFAAADMVKKTKFDEKLVQKSCFLKKNLILLHFFQFLLR